MKPVSECEVYTTKTFNLENKAASDIKDKEKRALKKRTGKNTYGKDIVFEKQSTTNLTNFYSNSFLSVLHQNKALHNFYNRGKGPKDEPCFCLG